MCATCCAHACNWLFLRTLASSLEPSLRSPSAVIAITLTTVHNPISATLKTSIWRHPSRTCPSGHDAFNGCRLETLHRRLQGADGSQSVMKARAPPRKCVSNLKLHVEEAKMSVSDTAVSMAGHPHHVEQRVKLSIAHRTFSKPSVDGTDDVEVTR